MKNDTTEVTLKISGVDVDFIRKDAVPTIAKERKGAWTIGEKYLIRTVTMTLLGRLVYLDDKELILENASWIADTGRFHVALATGALSEIEPFPNEVGVGRGSIVDFCVWVHELPKTAK